MLFFFFFFKSSLDINRAFHGIPELFALFYSAMRSKRRIKLDHTAIRRIGYSTFFYRRMQNAPLAVD